MTKAHRVVTALLHEDGWQSLDEFPWVRLHELKGKISDEAYDALGSYSWAKDAKFKVVVNDEISDCYLANDFRGGVKVWLGSEDRWVTMPDEDSAFQRWLRDDGG